MENGQLAASQPRAVQPAQSALNVDARYRSSWSTKHFSLPIAANSALDEPARRAPRQ